LKSSIAIAASAFVLSLAPTAALAGPAEYNRGYYDCLAGRYDDEEDTRSYRQGCRAAHEEQGGDERPHYWRPDRGPPGPPPGPAIAPRPLPAAGIPNVIGTDAMGSLGVMASRGYRNVGTSITGGAIVGFYFNPQTRECVQLTSMNGRVIDARPSGDRRCR
jgi:hypothetical protein